MTKKRGEGNNIASHLDHFSENMIKEVSPKTVWLTLPLDHSFIKAPLNRKNDQGLKSVVFFGI